MGDNAEMTEGMSEERENAQQFHSLVRNWLETNKVELLDALRPIAYSLGSTPTERDEAARELLTSTVLTALTIEARFDPERSVKPWLLGIARKQALRQSSERRQARKRYVSGDTVVSETGETTELWEHLRLAFRTPGTGANAATVASTENPADYVVAREWARELISRLSPTDQEIITLSILEGLNGEEVAQRLGIQPNAARTRLHRAVQRLADIALTEEQNVLRPAFSTKSKRSVRNRDFGGVA